MGVSAEGMFHRIHDFGYQRNEKQAIGFGLFHLLLLLVGFVVALTLHGVLFAAPAEGEALLHQAVMVLSVAYIGWLAYRVLSAKGRMADVKSLLAGAAAVVLSVYGALLGLMVVVALTVLKSKVAAEVSHEKGE